MLPLNDVSSVGPAELPVLPRLMNDLRAFIGRRVADPADAADVLQDTLSRVITSLPTLRDEEAAFGFVYGIARRAIADHHRRSHRNREAPVGADVEPSDLLEDQGALEDASTAEASVLAERVLSSWLRGAVHELPEPYRATLIQTELEGRSYREVAEVEGVSLSAIKSRVSRGREKLRAALLACCDVVLDARGRIMEATPRGRCGC